MKSTLIAALLVMSALVAGAQIPQGTIMIGGSVEFESEKDKIKDDNGTADQGTRIAFSFNPQFGYFVIDNLALGAGIGLNTETNKSDGGGVKSVSNGIAFTPFARYYFNKVFVHGQGTFGSQKSEYSGIAIDTELKYTVSAWNLGVGYAIFLNDNIAIEPMVGYRSGSLKIKGEDEKSITSGLYLRIGVQAYLGR